MTKMLWMWCKSPRSIMATSKWRLAMIRHRRSCVDGVRMMSLTYRSRYTMVTPTWSTRRDVSEVEAMK